MSVQTTRIPQLQHRLTFSRALHRVTGTAFILAAAAFVSPALAEAVPATSDAAAPHPLSQPLAVEVVTVKIAPSSQIFALTGQIEARNTLSAAFTASGRIAEVLVKEGDQVKKGEKLARIEQVQQEQNLRAAQAGLVTARADARQAQDDFTRKEALLERGAITRTARDTAEDTLRTAEAGVAQAEAELDLATKALADTVLLAPADAIVTKRAAEVGQVVGAAQTVIELALGTEYDAVFDVPEVMLTVPRKAPVVDLQLIDIKGPTFSGEVRQISPLIDPELGTVEVKIGVSDPPPGIGFGASVRGSIRREEAANAVLPFSALTATAEGPAVWVVDPTRQIVSLRQVQVLRHESGRVLIDGGLTDGDLVVGRGNQLLFPGREVRAVVVADGAEGDGQ